MIDGQNTILCEMRPYCADKDHALVISIFFMTQTCFIRNPYSSFHQTENVANLRK